MTLPLGFCAWEDCYSCLVTSLAPSESSNSPCDHSSAEKQNGGTRFRNRLYTITQSGNQDVVIKTRVTVGPAPNVHATSQDRFDLRFG